jgi:cytochrome oxidase assembly protein ShyY1
VIGHVLVVALVAVCIGAGFWQLRRLDERRTRNAAIEARSSVPVQPVDQVVATDAGFTEAEGFVYRKVTARGTYDADGSVLVRSRSLNGQPGFHVLTPLITGEGDALIVNRGFAPFTDEPAQALGAIRPPGGEVEVSGLLLGTQEREGIGPTDPESGVLTQIARIDLARLQQQYEAELYPLYLQLGSQSPAPTGELPVVLPEPEQGEGNHLSYAVQWFLFAAIGAGGWPLLLRSTARERHPDPFFVGAAVPGTAQSTKNEAVDEAVAVSRS